MFSINKSERIVSLHGWFCSSGSHLVALSTRRIKYGVDTHNCHYEANIFFTRLCCAQYGQKKETVTWKTITFISVYKPTCYKYLSCTDNLQILFCADNRHYSIGTSGFKKFGHVSWWYLTASSGAVYFFCPCCVQQSLMKNNTGA